MSTTTEKKYELITDWLPVEYKEITGDMKEYTDEEDYIQPCFTYEDETYWLSDFIRCHNNSWSGMEDAPDYIHGYHQSMYWKPLFIEVDDVGETVRLYRYCNAQ